MDTKNCVACGMEIDRAFLCRLCFEAWLEGEDGSVQDG